MATQTRRWGPGTEMFPARPSEILEIPVKWALSADSQAVGAHRTRRRQRRPLKARPAQRALQAVRELLLHRAPRRMPGAEAAYSAALSLRVSSRMWCLTSRRTTA